MTHAIYVTKEDMERLQRLLDHTAMTQRPYLDRLERLLQGAATLEAARVPPDTITMNSTAYLTDLATGEEITLTVTYPENADIANGRISVLAPVGMAILGRRAGAIVEWDVPAGIRALRVERVLFQPEAAGDLSL